MSQVIENFQRLVIRVKLDKAISYSPSFFTLPLKDLWFDFLDIEDIHEPTLFSHFVPVNNNFSFYSSKKALDSFDLNIVYSDVSIQKQFVENILLSDSQKMFANESLFIDRIFVHKIPSLQSLSDLYETEVTFHFNSPSFLLSNERKDKTSFPHLSTLLTSLKFRLGELLENNGFFKSIPDSLFNELDFSLSSYFLRSYKFKQEDKTIACLGSVSFSFSVIPKELLYLFYLINAFGLGEKARQGFGWVNVVFKEKETEQVDF